MHSLRKYARASDAQWDELCHSRDLLPLESSPSSRASSSELEREESQDAWVTTPAGSTLENISLSSIESDDVPRLAPICVDAAEQKARKTRRARISSTLEIYSAPASSNGSFGVGYLMEEPPRRAVNLPPMGLIGAPLYPCMHAVYSCLQGMVAN